jgi:hypothetical protein
MLEMQAGESATEIIAFDVAGWFSEPIQRINNEFDASDSSPASRAFHGKIDIDQSLWALYRTCHLQNLGGLYRLDAAILSKEYDTT